MKLIPLSFGFALILALFPPSSGFPFSLLADQYWGAGKGKSPTGIIEGTIGYTYSNSNNPTYLNDTNCTTAVQSAFDKWKNVTDCTHGITFGSGSDIVVAWSDEESDYGALGVTYPPDYSGIKIYYMISLPSGLQWTTSGSASQSQVSMVAVGAHEIGHALGLNHSRETTALMYFTELGTGGLSSDDKQGFCYIYDPNSPLKGADCDYCEIAADCSSGYTCKGLGTYKYCLKSCTLSSQCADTSYSCSGGLCYPIHSVCSEYESASFSDGEYCFAQNQCGDGSECVPFGTDYAMCTRECTRDSNCKNGMKCVTELTTGGTGICMFQKAFGETCSTYYECVDFICHEYPDGKKFCLEQCTDTGGTCPQDAPCINSSSYTVDICLYPECNWYLQTGCDSGYQCDWQESHRGMCVEKNNKATSGACSASWKCEIGYLCKGDPKECRKACHSTLNQGCGSGESCLLDSSEGEPIGYCMSATPVQDAGVADTAPPDSGEFDAGQSDQGTDSGENEEEGGDSSCSSLKLNPPSTPIPLPFLIFLIGFLIWAGRRQRLSKDPSRE